MRVAPLAVVAPDLSTARRLRLPASSLRATVASCTAMIAAGVPVRSW